MSRILLPLLFVWSSVTAALAQVTEDRTTVVIDGAAPMLTIRVLDAATDIPLAGAGIRLVLEAGDTVTLAAGPDGALLYTKRLPTDSLTLFFSYMGYKSLSYRHKIERSYTSLTARLTEDSKAINAIIVRGDRIAMVVKGDTTIYNASAFQTMRSDPMLELLKKLPGVEYRDGTFYANGERINRILINGTSLFGTQTQAASELIRADEVTNVKIYDQHPEEKRLLGDTLGARERVMDVTTRNKITRVSQVNLSAAWGKSLDKDESGRSRSLWKGGGTYDRFELKKASVSGNVFYGDNLNGNTPTSDDRKSWQGNFMARSVPGKKLNYLLNTSVTGSDVSDYTASENDYFPSSDYASRRYTQESAQRRRQWDISSRNEFLYRFNKRNQLAFGVNGAYADYLNRNTEQALAVTDDRPTDRMNLRRRSRTTQYSVEGNVGYKHFFKNTRRRLNLDFSYKRGVNDGDGRRLDTLSSSTRRQWLTDRSDGWNDAYTVSAGYMEPLAQNLYIQFSYRLTDLDSRAERLATDELTRRTDTLNTYLYTLRNTTHNTGANFRYRKGDRFGFSIGAFYQAETQKRDEKFPEPYRQPKTFDHVLPQAELEYNLPLIRFSLIYKENALPLSVENLRGVIDDSNPLFLRAGNPHLKQGVHRGLELRCNITSTASASAWGFVLKGAFVSDYLANRTRYFTEETPLPEYGYTAAAGTTLTTPENVRGKKSADAEVSYSKNSNRLESTLRAALSYHFDRTPYFNTDVFFNNDLHGVSGDLLFLSGFSKTVEVELRSRTDWSYTTKGGGESYETWQEYASGNIRVNFLKRWWIKGNIAYSYYNTSVPNTRNESTLLNASLAYRFGKKDAGEIGFYLNDLLNQSESLEVTMQDDYIRTLRRRVYGRSCHFSLSYRF